MRLAIVAVAGLAIATRVPPARADALRRTVAPMTRADGNVCDLLRAQISDTCKRVAQDGGVAVYQSGSKAAGIRRLVLAIDTGDDVLVGPAVDVLVDQLESTRPTLRTVAIDGRPGVVLDLVATWKRGKAAERARSLVGCAQVEAIWKCSLVDVGACDASVGPDGRVTTSCGATSTLSVGSPRA
ncbi:MAG TPA: hypothetical protein VFT22_42675 [Kofleriaceae bacterium]|nr:hypothetical protein [Kofleriaceae bacterium]